MPDQTETGPVESPKPGAGPDIQQLAERVYRLLLADVRLERARTGTGAARGRG